MKSIFNGMGHKLVDDQASGGKRVETDLLGCYHCQALIDKPQWQASGAYCPQCDGPICIQCARRMTQVGCENFYRKFVERINDAYRKEQNRKVLGI